MSVNVLKLPGYNVYLARIDLVETLDNFQNAVLNVVSGQSRDVASGQNLSASSTRGSSENSSGTKKHVYICKYMSRKKRKEKKSMNRRSYPAVSSNPFTPVHEILS